MAMSEALEQELKSRLRDLVQRKGRALNVRELYENWDADENTPDHERYSGGFSYGDFTDSEAEDHVRPLFDRKNKKGCQWQVPKGAKVQEIVVREFAGTFVENDEYGLIVVWGCKCSCGKYVNQPLRFKGTISEILQDIFQDQKDSLTL